MTRRSTLPTIIAVLATLVAQQLVAQETDEATPTEAPVEGVDLRVYTGAGHASSLADILSAMDGAEALLVGEEHDDLGGHGFQLQLLTGAVSRFEGANARRPRPVVLSLEMFESDVQYVLDEYLTDLISEDHFLRSSRPWDDYEARYRAMVEFAKAHDLPVVAANAPRRYVNRVSREGPESLAELSERALAYLPPLPFPGPSDAYRAEWDALMEEAMAEMLAAAAADDATPTDGSAEEADEPTDDTPPHRPNTNAIYSQALWDAAMGHAITSALEEHRGSLVIHLAGSFHVANGTGIPERIRDYRPEARFVTVVMVAVDDVNSWDPDEHDGQGDFVVLTKKPASTADSPTS
jgi:uncharacterized iron-regulated protein